MKRSILLLATTVSLVAGPVLASNVRHCSTELHQLDTAIQRSAASKSSIVQAKALREEAANSCTEDFGYSHGVAEIKKAMMLIGAGN